MTTKCAGLNCGTTTGNHSPECRAEHAAAVAGGRFVKGDAGINELAAKQYDWVERMGWHNKTVLEALALIASEVGEAVNECRGEVPTEKLGEELADIILRTLDLAQWQGINLAEEIAEKMAINEQRGTRGRRI